MESPEPDPQSFHPAFQFVFLRIFLFGLAVGASLTVGARQFGVNVPGVVSWTFVQLVCIVYIWAVVSALVVLKMLSVRVSDEGIWGMTFWGSRRFLAWDTVTGVRPLTLWPMRFWRLYPLDGTAPVWVPQFMKDRAGFRESVLAHTSMGNPLRAFLERV